MQINNWSVVSDSDPFKVPEQSKIRLQGEVTGHPRFDEGHRVTTSTIVKIEGKLVSTYSGSVYELGEIDPLYKKWVDKNYPDWDPENPIKMVENFKGE